MTVGAFFQRAATAGWGALAADPCMTLAPALHCAEIDLTALVDFVLFFLQPSIQTASGIEVSFSTSGIVVHRNKATESNLGTWSKNTVGSD